MEYYEFKSVQALPLLYAWTKAAIELAGLDDELGVLTDLQVDTRGDVDDNLRFPLCIAQVASGTPVGNGPYGAATSIRGRWTVQDTSPSRAQDLASKLVRALHRAWRSGITTEEGWVSSFRVTSEPAQETTYESTSDLYRYAMIAVITARKE